MHRYIDNYTFTNRNICEILIGLFSVSVGIGYCVSCVFSKLRELQTLDHFAELNIIFRLFFVIILGHKTAPSFRICTLTLMDEKYVVM